MSPTLPPHDAEALPLAEPLPGFDDEVAIGYEAALPCHLFHDEVPRDADRRQNWDR